MRMRMNRRMENLLECTKRAGNATEPEKLTGAGASPAKTVKVACSDRCDVVQLHAAHLRQTPGRLHHKCRLVALPPVWHRRKIGCVGLDQQPVFGRQSRGLAQVARFRECQNAAEAEVKPQFQGLFGFFRPACEAVHDAAVGQAGLADHRKRVLPGLARVDDDGFSCACGQIELRGKDRALHVARREVVMIIEADFANGQHFRVARQLAQARERFGRSLRRVVRMRAHRRIDERILRGQPDSDFEIGRTAASPDGHHALDTGGAGAFDGCVAVARQLLVVQMAVGIYQLHFSRAPTGISSRNPASTGLPPSTDAAKIIPFEVSPRSLRGARLATMTTFRPTSASGAYASAMPATTERGSASARSTFRCSSLSAPLTRSAESTWPTRSSTF